MLLFSACPSLTASVRPEKFHSTVSHNAMDNNATKLWSMMFPHNAVDEMIAF